MQAFDETVFPKQGRQLIEASAGTGKTYTLMSLAVRALAAGMRPELLLMLTFTRASTRELRARLRERIRAEIDGRASNKVGYNEQIELLKRALRKINQVQIQTIHGFAAQLVANYGAYANETMREIVEDTAKLQTEAALDVYHNLVSTDQSGLAPTILGMPDQFLTKKYLAFKNAQQWIPHPKTLPDLTQIHMEYADRAARLTATIDNLFSLKKIQKAAASRHLLVFEQAKYPWQIPSGSLKYFKDREEDLVEHGLDNWLTIAEPTSTMRNYRAYALLQIKVRYQELLNARGINDPDQLTKKAVHISRLIPKAERPTHRVILIDEFQDTDRYQWSMLDELYPDANDRLFVMVGDPKQAIYRFRGADTLFYKHLAKQLPTHQRWTLNTVYRSATSIVSGLNALFNPLHTIGKKLNYHALSANKHNKISALTLDNQPLTGFQWGALTSADDVVHTIKTLVSLGKNHRLLCQGQPLKSSDIGVLVRTREIADQIKRIAEGNGIACHFQDRSSVFQKPLCQDMCALLEAIAYPDDLSRLVNGAATNIAGFDLQSTGLFLDDPKFQEFKECVFQTRRIWTSHGPTRAIAELLKHCSTEERIENSYLGLEQWSDLTHALEFFGKTAKDLSPAEAVRWWETRGLNNNDTDEAERPRSPVRNGVVQISTIHGAKGLEYPVVLLTGQLKTKEPKFANWGFDYVTPEGLVVDFSSNASKYWLIDEEFDVFRLIYVALTRARHAVFVDHPAPDSSIDKLWDDRTIESLGPDHSVWDQSSEITTIEQPVIPFLEPSVLNKSIQTVWSFRSFSNIFKSDHNQRDQAPAGDELHSGIIDLSECKKWHQLPGGKETGNFVHQILEWDARAIYTNEDRITYINQNSPPHLDHNHRAVISHWIELIRHVPLHQTNTLASIKNTQKCAESRFELVLKTGLSTNDLVSQLIRLSWYQPPDQLSWQSLEGHLIGFIDLVFESEGQFHILDYKTNTFGPDDPAYSMTAINHQMHTSHYTAQAALYGLALHKWLEKKLDGYEPKKHLGDVIYLFCRGISGPCQGIWRQPLEADALSTIAVEMLDAR